jgi:hypothetical protein
LRAGFFFARTFGEATEAVFVIFFPAFFFAGAFLTALADFTPAALAADFFAAGFFAAGFDFDLIVRFMLVSCLLMRRLMSSRLLDPSSADAIDGTHLGARN